MTFPRLSSSSSSPSSSSCYQRRCRHLVFLILVGIALTTLYYNSPAATIVSEQQEKRFPKSGPNIMTTAERLTPGFEQPDFTPSYTLQQNQQQHKSSLKFVFYVGLEGTGHHLVRSLLNGAPDIQKLRDWGILPGEIVKVQQFLFRMNGKGKTGIWNAHCELQDAENLKLLDLESHISQQLQHMEHMANINGTQTIQTHVPLNTLVIAPGYGQVSYPNYMGDCRRLNIPYLDMLYRACGKARVDCGHVYLYRDPLMAMLKSTTTNRGFNEEDGMIASMHMYKTHLNVIASEMHAFPQQTLGCYNLLGNITDGAWQDDLWQMWGWKTRQEWDLYSKKILRKPGNSKGVHTNKDALPFAIPPQWEPYWMTLREAHERVIRICEKAAAGKLEAD